MNLIVCNKRGKKAPTPSYDDAVDHLNPHDFTDGLLYRVSQNPKDETLEGKELIIFSFKADVKTGLMGTIPPTRMKYELGELNYRFINLRKVSGGGLIKPNWWEVLYVYVYNIESADKAISDYNSMISDFKVEREAYLLEQIKKELKPHASKQVKRLK